MKALLRLRPGEVALADRPLPDPAPGEALLRVLACGLCGSDLERLRSADEHWNQVVLGHECSAVIEALGPPRPTPSPVSLPPGLVPGRRVALLPLLPHWEHPLSRRGLFSLGAGYSFLGSRRDGGFAEYLLAPLENLLPLPDSVSDEAGALLEPLSVATEACLLAGEVEGATVLVMGAGAIGLLAVQVARLLGAAQVLACDLVPARLELAARLGATPLLASAAPLEEQVAPLTAGLGVEVCLECSGHPAGQRAALTALAPAGRLVLVGTGPGDLVLDADLRERLCRRMLTLRGQWMSYRAPWPGASWTLPLDWLDRGLLDPTVILSHRVSLEEAPALFARLFAPGADFLKVLLKP